MEIKGRITAAGPLETKARKDGNGTYTQFPIRIQIGVYKAWQRSGLSGQMQEVDRPDVVGVTYFHDDAREAAAAFGVGDVVKVNLHHSVNDYGRTEAVVDKLDMVKKVAQPSAAAPAPAPAAQPSTAASAPAPAAVEAEKTDDLPF